MLLLLQIIGGIAGASLASTVQCAAERYLVSENWLLEWATGRSVCDGCDKELKWYQLAPVLSFLIGQGKASCCGARLSPLYVVMEIIGAVLGVLAVGLALDGDWRAFVIAVLVGFVGIIGFTTDYKAMHLPVVPLGITALIVMLLNPSVSVAIGTLVGISMIGFLFLVTRGKGMGSGDIVLAGLLGALVGYPLIIPNLVVSFIIGAGIALLLMVFKNATKSDPLPFGVFLIPLLWMHLLFPHWLDWLVAVYGLG